MANKYPNVAHLIDQIVAFATAGNYEQALDLCNSVIAANPTSFEAFWERADLLFRVGQHKEAISDLDKLLVLSPSSVGTYFRRARWNLELGNYDAAIEDLDILLEANDQAFIDAALCFRSMAHLERGDTAAAHADCLKLPCEFSFFVRTHKNNGQLISRETLLETIAAKTMIPGSS